jgi:hypothetical protein
MKRFLCAARIALPCILLGAFGSARADGPTGGELGAAFARWRSCVQLIHPEGRYSAADLQGMIERPNGIKQLLRNLKLAWDGDLLVEPSLYNQGVLQKFFDGADITWKAATLPLGKDVGYVAVQLDIGV